MADAGHQKRVAHAACKDRAVPYLQMAHPANSHTARAHRSLVLKNNRVVKTSNEDPTAVTKSGIENLLFETNPT